MKNLRLMLGTLIIACSFTLISINSNAIAGDNCAELLNSKCSSCHNLNRVCQKVGKKNKKRWANTIKRMIKRGTELTKSEKKDILNCLADESPGTMQACK